MWRKKILGINVRASVKQCTLIVSMKAQVQVTRNISNKIGPYLTRRLFGGKENIR